MIILSGLNYNSLACRVNLFMKWEKTSKINKRDSPQTNFSRCPNHFQYFSANFLLGLVIQNDPFCKQRDKYLCMSCSAAVNNPFYHPQISSQENKISLLLDF
jgi:hypothetical protein